ncbi:MAG: TonB-dependent receptor [Gemmatimonadota bacterium]
MQARWVVRSRAAMLASFMLLGLVAAPAFAQQTGQVTGLVTAASTGEPIVGAQIVVQGTGIGTLTNVRGQYLLLSVPTGSQTIEVTRLGYATASQVVTVTAGQAATANFELNTEAISLDAVVVTGTAGNARRRELGNTVATITADELSTEPITKPSDVLQGRAAGLVIRETSGQVGGGSQILLRGVNTLATGSSMRPLIYVDGVRLETGLHQDSDEASARATMFDDIDPASIERIEIVKGAAATTLYGTEAAAGVIQIFTKNGGGGSPTWTFSTDQGFSQVGHVGPSEDPTGLYVNDCTSQPGCPSSGTWLRKGYQQDYTLTVRGGNTVPWYASASWGAKQGNIAPQAEDNLNFRVNFTFEPLKNVSVRSSNMYTKRDITWIPSGDNAEGFMLNVMRGQHDYSPGHDDSAILKMDLHQLIDHFLTAANITWTPTANVMQRLNLGMDYSQSDYTEERPWGYYSTPGGDREVDQALHRNLTVDYAGSWNAALPVPNMASTLSWGAQYYDEFTWGLNGYGEQFAGPGDKLITSGTLTDVWGEDWLRIASGGFFVQEQLGWRDRLFVTFGARWDGFSTFGRDFGLAMYPKVSAAYTISDHSFWPSWWESMKLRAAVGESGRAPAPFAAERTWASTSGDTQQPAVILSELGNPKVGPERTRELEYGFEGSMLDGRFSYDFTYFQQTTRDALLRLDRPTSIGTEQAILSNLGRVENKGYELSANATVVRFENLSWDIGGTYSQAHNKIVSLGPVTDERLKDRPVDAMFGDIVQNPNEMGVVPEFAEEYLGPAIPTVNWGLHTDVTLFRRLTFSGLGEFQGGHMHEASIARQNVRRQEWAPCQYVFDALQSGNVSNISAKERGRCDYNRASYGEWTTKGDFFRLRSLALSYRVPDRFLPANFTGATVRFQARNILTITDFPGVDPEVVDGGAGNSYGSYEYYNIPTPAVFMMSLTFNF